MVGTLNPEMVGTLNQTAFEDLQVPYWQESSGASAFLINKEGVFATNRHVVEKGSDGEIIILARTSNDEPFQSTVLYTDPVRDFALGQIEGKISKPVTIGDSGKLREGQRVVVLGSPLGMAGSISDGIITSLPKPPSPGDNKSRAIQKSFIGTNADIRPGSSGGPMTDDWGKVIGINSVAFIDPNGSGSIGGTMPINEVKTIIEHPQVFIQMQDLFVRIALQRSREKPIALLDAYTTASKNMEQILMSELGDKNDTTAKEIMQDTAVQHYFQMLLKSAHSDVYRIKFLKTFGVPLTTVEVPKYKLGQGD